MKNVKVRRADGEIITIQVDDDQDVAAAGYTRVGESKPAAKKTAAKAVAPANKAATAKNKKA